MRWAWLLTTACYAEQAVEPPPPDQELIDGILDAHNGARAAKGVDPLVWNATLSSAAATWLLELDDRGCILEHTRNGDYGENLYWSSVPSTPDEVVDLWVAEEADYDYATNTCAPGAVCGHYTQVVWSGSTEVGCARERCAGGLGQLWMCNYDPPGNFVGSRPY